MSDKENVFDALKERFCAMQCGCFPTSSEVFESLLTGEEDGNI
jgi:hypothetical protein